MNFARSWRAVGLVVSVIVVLAALVGLAAPQLVRFDVRFDILANFRLHFWGLLVAGIAGILLRRYWLTALFVVIVATPVIIGIKPMLDRTSARPAEPGSGEAALRVVFFNTWHSNGRIDLLEQYLRKEDADVAILIEVAEEKKPLVDSLKDLYPHTQDCIDVIYCHLLILSKQPFAEGGHRMPRDGPPMVWVRYGEELGGLTVVGVHLSRIPRLDRQFVQVEELARETHERGDPIIVAGDFNATQWSLVVNSFQELSGLWRVTSLPTWPTWFFGLPQIGIDHMFISNGVLPLEYPRVGDDLGSDHLPIAASFAVAKPE